MESGAFCESEHGEASPFEQARQLGEIFIQRVNVTTEGGLRAHPAAVVNQAELRNPATGPRITAYSPTIDDYVLTNNPFNVFRGDEQLKISSPSRHQRQKKNNSSSSFSHLASRPT
jgi:para-nitrobenzyl esterase